MIRLETPLKHVFVEQRSDKPLLYGHFGRVSVVATTERAASGGFGRNGANRKCLKTRFLGQILNTSISITKPLLFQLSYGGNVPIIKDL